MPTLDMALDAIKALGIAGGPVFAFLWWLERSERISCQKIIKDLLIQTLTVTNQSANAVAVVSATVGELREALKDLEQRLTQLILTIKKSD